MLNLLENITPTKQRKTGTENCNGNISVFGIYQGRKVKLYQPFDQKQIDLRIKVQNSSCGKFFPKIIDHDDTYVIEEFIDHSGDMVDSKVMFDLVMNLRLIKAEPDWCYMKHIYERVELTMPDRYNELPSYVNHNDINTGNIVIDRKSGIPKVIDNEALACNTGWFMNLLNGRQLFANVPAIARLKFYENMTEHEAQKIFNNVRTKWKK